jgi:hypothetical protein
MQSQTARSFKQRRKRLMSPIVLNDSTGSIQSMNFVVFTQTTTGNDADGKFFNGDFREFLLNRCNQGVNGFGVLAVATRVKLRHRPNVICGAFLPKARLDFRFGHFD